MQDNPQYSDAGVVSDIKEFFEQRIKAALDSGIKKENIVLDPGFGFGKTLMHNFELLEGLGEFKKTGYPVLAGISRKSMIGKILNAEPKDRLFGTAAAVALSIVRGASIVRVHDVREMKDTARMTDAMLNFRDKEGGR
jgi:dihydropteroate synthase